MKKFFRFIGVLIVFCFLFVIFGTRWQNQKEEENRELISTKNIENQSEEGAQETQGSDELDSKKLKSDSNEFNFDKSKLSKSDSNGLNSEEQNDATLSEKSANSTRSEASKSKASSKKEKSLTEKEPEDKYATILSFGDTLVHSQVYKQAYDSTTDTYDFFPIFTEITKYFQDADITIGNAESPMAGKDRGYSGYPTFNAPEHLAVDLKELGVDILTTANNHCLDKGYSGLENTLNNLDSAGIAHTGTSRSVEEQNTILHREVNGIDICFLSFTYGTNGISIPSDKTYCVNIIDKQEIEKRILQAKSEYPNSAIVVSMHWGIEYQTTPSSQQDDLANFLIANGADVVLGCHPHVLQPMKMVTATDENGVERQGLVIYSQGNFFSSQTKPNTRNTALFQITLKSDGSTGKISVDNAKYVPLYLYDKRTTQNRYELLDLNQIIQDYESGSDKWSKDMYYLAVTEKDRCVSTIGPEIDNQATNQ